jgi:hypothetical protein
MDNSTEQQHKSYELKSTERNARELSDIEWTIEAAIDKLQCNLASAEQRVTNKTGQTLTIRKYQSQCRKLARSIPIVSPTPEYPIYSSDLKPEVRQRLETGYFTDKLSHPRIREIILHQAVLRLFESLGFEPYLSIGRKLKVKLIED